MDYLHRELSHPLIEAVCDLCLKQPADPIEHLAQYLYSYRQQHTLSQHSSGDSDSSAVHRRSSPAPSFSPARSPSMDSSAAAAASEQMDFLDFDIPPVAGHSSSSGMSVELMMTANEKSAVHVHVDAIKIHEDLFDDDDLS